MRETSLKKLASFSNIFTTMKCEKSHNYNPDVERHCHTT